MGKAATIRPLSTPLALWIDAREARARTLHALTQQLNGKGLMVNGGSWRTLDKSATSPDSKAQVAFDGAPIRPAVRRVSHGR